MPSTGRGATGSPGGGGSSTSSQLPAVSRSPLPRDPAVDHHAAGVGDLGRGGAREPEQPGERLVDPLTLEPVGHREGAVQAGESSSRLPL